VEDEESEDQDFVEMQCATDADLLDDDRTPEIEERGHVIYGSIGNVVVDFNQHKPVSVVAVRGENGKPEFHCCVRNFGQKLAMQLELREEEGSLWRFGLHYFNFRMMEGGEKIEWKEMCIHKYAMMLPLERKVAEEGKNQYAVISSDWSCLGKNGVFVAAHEQVSETELETWRSG